MTPDERTAICKSCEWYRAVINQCKKCGCFVYVKTKLPNAKCPIRKW